MIRFVNLWLLLVALLPSTLSTPRNVVQRKKLQLDAVLHRCLRQDASSQQAAPNMYRMVMNTTNKNGLHELHAPSVKDSLQVSWLQTKPKVSLSSSVWSWFSNSQWTVQSRDMLQNQQALKTPKNDPKDGGWGELLPNVTDKKTIVATAKMAAIAYYQPDSGKWDPVKHFPSNDSFGWKNDGLRGYVFATEEKDFVIISLKGTSASFLGIGGGDTSNLDKLNDNHMFSCCCARVDRTWHSVCDCHQPLGVCNLTCVRNDTQTYEHSYYEAGKDLFNHVQKMYPKATIWFTGHSLGGALSALLALFFNKPAITFEAPGELMFAKRIGLDVSQNMSTLPIYHFGNNADPIFMGSCRGTRSSCYYAGYALETKCHIGHVCTYKVRKVVEEESQPIEQENIFEAVGNTLIDAVEHLEDSVNWWPWPHNTTVVDPPPTTSVPNTPTLTHTASPSPTPTLPNLNWGVDIRHHQIWDVIDNVIEPWPTAAACQVNSQCRDCVGWQYV